MKESIDKVAVREMQFEDIVVVYHLGESLYTADKWPVLYRNWDEYEIIERFISDQQFCFVAEIGTKIVGFSIGTIIEKPKSSWSYGYMLWIGVSPKAQGLGVGQKLMQRLTRKFIEEGAKMMMVDTASENEKAISFFKKKGFDNIDDHVYMTKNLLDDPYYQTLKKRGDI